MIINYENFKKLILEKATSEKLKVYQVSLSMPTTPFTKRNYKTRFTVASTKKEAKYNLTYSGQEVSNVIERTDLYGQAFENNEDGYAIFLDTLEGYGGRWKPNATQRREFAEKMKDPDEKAAYEERKRAKQGYENFDKKDFIPTKEQYDAAMQALGDSDLTDEQKNGCIMVIQGYNSQEKIPHPYIHIVQEIRRKKL